MKTPVLHYDYWLGQEPSWRRLIHRGLQGDTSLLRLEYLLLKGHAPSKASFLSAMFGYALEGQQVFLVGPKLQGMLLDTDCDKVPLEFLRFPFNCFYIALADCPIKLYDGETAFHQATGIYVHLVDEEIPAVTLCLWGQENDNSRAAGDDALQWITLSLSEAVTQTDEDGVQYVDIDGYIRKIFSDPARDDSDPGTNWPEDSARNVKAVVDLARMAFNLILYVNSERPDTTTRPSTAPGRKKMLQAKLALVQKNSKKRKKAARIQKELDAISEARVIWLGKTIEETPEFPAEGAGNGEPERRPGRKVRRHRRRGGWHAYWTGPRKLADGTWQKGTEKILKWRKPRWVGSAIGDLIAHRGTTYKFRADRDDHDRPEGS